MCVRTLAVTLCEHEVQRASVGLGEEDDLDEELVRLGRVELAHPVRAAREPALVNRQPLPRDRLRRAQHLARVIHEGKDLPELVVVAAGRIHAGLVVDEVLQALHGLVAVVAHEATEVGVPKTKV